MTSLLQDRAVCTEAMLAVFGDEALLRAALNFESALAIAQAEEGLIPKSAAAAITNACAEIPDIALLAEQAAHAGTLAIPLVQALRGRVALADPSASALVHRGATSQDLADTALMLQVKAAGVLVWDGASRLGKALALLARTHAATPMLGRTLLQGALPITFGLKVAGWLGGLDAALGRFETETAVIHLQLGGPVGTMAGLEGKGRGVAARMADLLGLPAPILAWHARREGLAALGASLAILIGAIGKIARDISLMAQDEIGEAREPWAEGRGGSSAMAHKRNPTGCQVALSAAIRAPHLAASLIAGLPQEHERGLGGWQAEAPVLADLFQLADGVLAAMAPVIEGLEVDVARMAANLSAAGVGTDVGEAEALVARALAHHDGDH